MEANQNTNQNSIPLHNSMDPPGASKCSWRHDGGYDDDDDNESVEVIENALKQVAFASARGAVLDDVNIGEQEQTPITTTPRHREVVQLHVDRRGGPDFKAQLDSRTVLGDQDIVRALPAQEGAADADFYGRAAVVNVQRIEETAEQDDVVAIVRAELPPSSERPRSGSFTDRKKLKPTPLASSEKIFWIRIISIGVVLNMILVAGVTFSWLYFTGSFNQKDPTPIASRAPSPFPVPAPTLPPFPVIPSNSGENSNTASLANANSIFVVRPTPPTASPASSLAPVSPPEVNDTPKPTQADDLQESSTTAKDNHSSPDAMDDYAEQNTVGAALLISSIGTSAIVVEAMIISGLVWVYRRWRNRTDDELPTCSIGDSTTS